MARYKSIPYHLNLTGGLSGYNNPGGKIFWVGASGYTAAGEGVNPSNNNTGEAPQEPFSTIQYALDQCVAGRGDIVAVLPGSYTVTAALTMTKSHVTLTSAFPVAPRERSSVVIVNATDVETITVDADYCTVYGLTIDDNISAATANSANIRVNSSNTATDYTGVKIINCWIDMAGADTDRDGITLGVDADATDGAIEGLVQGCVVFNCEQDAITLNVGSDRAKVVDCLVFDDGTRLTRYGVEVLAVGCLIEDCDIQVSDTATPGACIHNGVAAARLRVNGCRLNATGADTFGIKAIATATQFTTENSIVAVAAGNHIDYTTDNTSPSSDVGFTGVFAASPGAGVFVTPTVDGT